MGLGRFELPTSRLSGVENRKGKVKTVKDLGAVTWVAFTFFAFQGVRASRPSRLDRTPEPDRRESAEPKNAGVRFRGADHSRMAFSSPAVVTAAW